METRRLTVSNKNIVVLDNADLGEEFNDFHEYIFKAASFTLSQSDSYEALNEVGPYWAFSIKPDTFSSGELGQIILELVKKHFKDADWKYCKVHVNALQYGDAGFVHTDGNFLEGHTLNATALIYLNSEWKADFSGETIFFNDDLDAECAVSPKFKRVVIFDGEIQHSARPPSKNCIFRRKVLVAKLSAEDKND